MDMLALIELVNEKTIRNFFQTEWATLRYDRTVTTTTSQ